MNCDSVFSHLLKKYKIESCFVFDIKKIKIEGLF